MAFYFSLIHGCIGDTLRKLIQLVFDIIHVSGTTSMDIFLFELDYMGSLLHLFSDLELGPGLDEYSRFRFPKIDKSERFNLLNVVNL